MTRSEAAPAISLPLQEGMATRIVSATAIDGRSVRTQPSQTHTRTADSISTTTTTKERTQIAHLK